MKLLTNLVLLLSCWVFSLQAQSDFSEFIKNKQLHKGHYSFYHDENAGNIYLEISSFNQQFLFQSSLPHGIGSNDIGLDRGQLGDTRLVQFERVGDKVFLRQLNSYYRADSANPQEKHAIEQAFASSIIWGFKVEAISSDKQRVLIDYTPFLLSDIHNIAASLKEAKQGSYKIAADRSGIYAKRSKAFPDNTELEATVTYVGSKAGEYLRAVTPDKNAVTVNLHHSLIRLPDDEYQTRQFHPYSGYWSIEYADYASAIDQPLIKRLIPRHRLNKKNPDKKLSEAVEPIIYYLDPGVPEPVRSALMDGALWWDQAFTDLGYKNAFQVKMLPPDADPMDVRFNVIQWVHRATRGWSYGSSVIDPRSGEIIKGHVTLGSLRVRQDYLIALGLTSPFKNKQTDTSAMKEMALARIRQLAAHEVGHTLGIAHNFAASANDRASVMDYPHPYIELVDGEINLSNAYAVDLGVWDKYVVAYGYSDFAQQSSDIALRALVKKTQKQGLQYISDADARDGSGGHASAHLWDNGKDAVAELKRILKVRSKALENFGANSIAYNTPLSQLEQVLAPIYNFHRYQVTAVAKLIAGVNYSYEVRDSDSLAGISRVPAAIQHKALQALLSTLTVETLAIPERIIDLIPPKAMGYYRDRESLVGHTGLTFDPVSAAHASAKHTLNALLNPQRLARAQQQAVLDQEIPNVLGLVEALLEKTVKNPAQNGLNLLVQQRVNQQVVDSLLVLWHQKELVTEVRADILLSLEDLVVWLSRWSENNKIQRRNQPHYAHYQLLKQHIQYSLTLGKQVIPAATVKLVPGSPIG
jgi:hypothetical protein